MQGKIGDRITYLVLIILRIVTAVKGPGTFPYSPWMYRASFSDFVSP